MKCGLRIALGVGAGYFLGRTKKMKLAMMLGGMAAGGQAGGPGELLKSGTKLLNSSPELSRLVDEVRGRLLETGKGAVMAVAARQVESLTDRVGKRVESFGDVGVPRRKKAEAEPATDEYAEDEYAEDEYAEDEGAEDEGAEDEGAEDEGAEDEGAEDEYAEDEYAEDEGAEDEGAEDEGAEDEGAEDEGAEDEYAEDEGAEPEDEETGGAAEAAPPARPRPRSGKAAPARAGKDAAATATLKRTIAPVAGTAGKVAAGRRSGRPADSDG